MPRTRLLGEAVRRAMDFRQRIGDRPVCRCRFRRLCSAIRWGQLRAATSRWDLTFTATPNGAVEQWADDHKPGSPWGTRLRAVRLTG